MKKTWNLDSLYTGFTSKAFLKDQEKMNAIRHSIQKWSDINLVNQDNVLIIINEFLELYSNYKNMYSKLYNYAYLIYSADNTNQAAIDVLEQIDYKDIAINKVYVKFVHWMSGVDHILDIIKSSEKLSDYHHYLENILNQSHYMLSEDIETIIAKNRMTGSKSWERLYMSSISSLQIDFPLNSKSKKVTLQELQALLLNEDSEIRKAAYQKEGEVLSSISTVAAACLNGISGEALNVYDLKGYASPLDKVLVESKMTRKTLDTMFAAIRAQLPQFHKYYKKKAEILGHKGKIAFYDIFAPIVSCEDQVTFEQSKDLIIESFMSFNSDLSNFAKKVFDHEWIDYEVRNGKGNYGLCVDIFPIKESRIMTSFTGSLTDVGILAHEIGHAYHSNCLNEEILNTDYPSAIAETASIFAETIVNKALIKNDRFPNKWMVLEKNISDACYFIVEFYARYLFENKLYEKRRLGYVSVEVLNHLMIECLIEAFGDSLDTESLHPYLWASKIGYYMTEHEYLNFPYTFGILFSKGLYGHYTKKGDAFSNTFSEKLACTSKNSIDDIAKMFEVDIKSKDFWYDAIQLVLDDIEEFCNFNQ